MSDLTPHKPENRILLWSDAIVDLQEILADKIQADVYILGGAVRDAFLHHPIKDLDLATPDNAVKIAKTIAFI